VSLPGKSLTRKDEALAVTVPSGLISGLDSNHHWRRIKTVVRWKSRDGKVGSKTKLLEKKGSAGLERGKAYLKLENKTTITVTLCSHT